jgi:hypothetical protein
VRPGRPLAVAAFLLATAGLLLGASWLVWGLWWVAGDDTRASRDASALDEEDPTLVGLGTKPDAAPDPEKSVDPDALLAALEGKSPKEQASLLFLAPGPIPYHEQLAGFMLAKLEVNERPGNWCWRQALGRMQPAPVDATFRLLRHDRWPTRVEAIYLLGLWRSRGEDVPPLPYRDLLEDRHEKVRAMAAMVATSGIPYDTDLAMWLLDQIQPGDRGPNWAPERILARMGPEGLALLVPLLDSPDEALRMQALWGMRVARLEELRPHAGAIAAAVRDQHEDVRVAALEALRRFEGDCEACLPSVIDALGDESVLVIAAALTVVEQMGARAAKAVPALIRLMDYEADDRIARHAASLLGDLKARPDLVLPALAEALHGDTSQAAARALGQFGAAALPHALKAFRESDEDARYAALLALEALGPSATSFAPQLPALIRGDDIEIAQQAIRVARAIGRDARVALPAVLERVWEGDIIPPDRWAAEVLMALGPDAETALREELRGQNPENRDTALRIVARCWGRSAFAFPELIPLLSSSDVETRRRAVAAVAVSVSDPGGESVVSPKSDPTLRARVRDLLQPLGKDDDWQIREWVADTLRQIDAVAK